MVEKIQRWVERGVSWHSEKVHGSHYVGVIWRLLEQNRGHSEGFDLQHGFELLDYQVVLDHKRIQTFCYFGVITMWNVGKMWKYMGIGVVCLDSESQSYEWHVILMELRPCISLYSCESPSSNYKELQSNGTFNGVIGSIALYSSELTIFFSCKALYYGWPSAFCDEILHCSRHVWGFWSLLLLEYNFKMAFLMKMTISLFWNLDWRLLRNDRYSGSYQDDVLIRCEFVLQLVKLLNVVLVKWKGGAGIRSFLDIFMPEFSCSKEQFKYYYI